MRHLMLSLLTACAVLLPSLAAAQGTATSSAAPAAAPNWLLTVTFRLGSVPMADALKLFDQLDEEVARKPVPQMVWHRYFTDEAADQAGMVSMWTTRPTEQDLQYGPASHLYARTESWMTGHGLTESDYTMSVVALVPGKGTRPGASSADAAAIQSAYKQLFAAFRAKDLDRALAVFDEGVEMVFRGPDGSENRSSGKEALRQGMEAFIEGLAAAYAKDPQVEVTVTGSTATASFRHTTSFPDPSSGEQRSFGFSVMDSLRKTPAGWRIVRQEVTLGP